MYRYFRYTLLYNYLVQLYILVIALAVIGPLYSHAYTGNSKSDFVLIIVMALLIKAWNFAANWMMFKIRNKKITLLDKIIRLILSIGIFYTLFEGFYSYIIVFIFFAAVINDYFLAKKQSGIAWDVLIENDQHRLSAFYRFVSSFAEVPQLTRRLKKRRMLAAFMEHRVPFKQSAAFHYLYRLTFIRSNDYLNLYIRLTVMGAIIMYFIPNSWVKLAIALLFVYMTSFQLIPLFHHYRTSIWIDLYPMDRSQQRASYMKDMKLLTIVQAVLFSLVFLFMLDFQSMIIMLIGGFLFMYLFYNGYVKKKIV